MPASIRYMICILLGCSPKAWSESFEETCWKHACRLSCGMLLEMCPCLCCFSRGTGRALLLCCPVFTLSAILPLSGLQAALPWHMEFGAVITRQAFWQWRFALPNESCFSWALSQRDSYCHKIWSPACSQITRCLLPGCVCSCQSFFPESPPVSFLLFQDICSELWSAEDLSWQYHSGLVDKHQIITLQWSGEL